MKLFYTFFLLFCSLASSTIASAELFESVETKNYFISPRNIHDIKHELARHTPIREHGGSFNGRTDWFVKWNFRSTQRQHGCQLLDVTVKVHVVYTLPALSDNVTDQQTIATFDKFNEALTKHEYNHGKNGLTAAREIDKALQNIQGNGPQQSCRNVARLIDDIGNSTIQKYAQADRDYDRLTRNGMTEGAVIY